MNPKLAALTVWSVGGIILPVFIPVPVPIAAICTGSATAMAYALSQEARVGAVQVEITRQRRENRIDRLITAEEYAHQAAMSRLEALYFSPVPQYQAPIYPISNPTGGGFLYSTAPGT